MPVARLRGTVEDRGDDWLVIDIGPMAMLVSVPGRTAAGAPVGAGVTLHTHLHVREDALALFGFASRDELTLFEQLIAVSGVGPRVALGMLSALGAAELALAIVGGRVETLRKVPGVGQKTAERIVIDLRDKVTPPAAEAGAPAGTPRDGSIDAEVVAALMGLGYTQAEAAAAAERAPANGGLALEERVRLALQSFARS